MKATSAGCLLLLFATDASAHRLDEYLQATRIAVTTNRIDLSFSLTPGVAVASQVLASIDKNRDGKISENERTDYGRQVLRDIDVRLDQNTLALSLVETTFPGLFEIQSGAGVIQIKATAPMDHLVVGKHTVSLTNNHLPAISVYLVNALSAKDATIQIGKQTRDELQKDYRLEFEVLAARR